MAKQHPHPPTPMHLFRLVPNLQEIPESAFECLAQRVCSHQGEKLLRVWKGMQLGRNLLPPEIHIKAGGKYTSFPETC